MIEAQADSVRRMAVEQIDRFGYLVADVAYERWCAGLNAPIWREAFENPKVLAFLDAEGYSAWLPVKEILMRRAALRGWLVYTQEPRSLRFGPTYLASTPKKTVVRQPHELGRRVACSIGGFVSRRHRYPTADDLVMFIRNPDGTHLFRSGAELTRNLPWLSVAGWVRYEGGEIRCGASAVAYDQERATRHHIKRELRLEARDHTEAGEGGESSSIRSLKLSRDEGASHANRKLGRQLSS